MAKTELSSPIDLIKKSITIFSKKENFIYFAKIYLPLAPFAIFSLFQSYLVKPDSLQSANPWFIALVVVINILYALVYVLISLAGIEAIKRVLNGGKLSFKNTIEAGWKKYWKFALLSLLTMLIVGFGFTLLIIPGIIFLTWYSFAKFIFVEDPKVGVLAALKKSKSLVKGRFWKVFGRLLVFAGFSFLVNILTALIPYSLGSILGVFLEVLFVIPVYLLYQELSA